MKKVITKQFNKKVRGVSDLIASIFAIFAISVFTYVYIMYIGDVFTKIEISQIVRNYTYRMETQGMLTSTDKTNMTNALKDIDVVNKAVAKGNSINITWNGTDGVTQGYGSSLILTVDVPAVKTSYIHNSGFFGTISRDEVITYHISKRTTAKY